MASASPPAGAAPDVVATAARAFERDRYLAALLAPQAARADLIALAAFAGEIARIPAYVSEPMLGEIRLQWWRDALERQLGVDWSPDESTGNPIADALGHTVRRHALAPNLLHGMIDAQAVRLIDAPFADQSSLAENLAASDGAQFTLAIHVLGVAPNTIDPALIDDASLAYGIARLLIELPATLAEQRILLPLDLMAAHNLSSEDTRGATAEVIHRLDPVIRELSSVAEAALGRFRANVRRAPPAARSALLPVALVRPYLRACQDGGSQYLGTRDIAPFTRVWRLGLAHVSGRL